jgi:hypothetical protein
VKVELQGKFEPTGRTRHFIGNQSAPTPSSLVIAQEEGDPGFYLLYLDGAGQPITDTYHDSLSKAMEQAQWEFSVGPDEWRPLFN